jgi:hypothetical protein
MKQRHLRPGDHLPDDATVVLRGGALDSALLRVDARRCHALYGHFGLSVFAARGISVDELAQAVPLVRFPVLTLMTVRALRRAGLTLLPTGRHHRHFTVVLPDLDGGLEALLRCERRTFINPYHEP